MKAQHLLLAPFIALPCMASEASPTTELEESLQGIINNFNAFSEIINELKDGKIKPTEASAIINELYAVQAENIGQYNLLYEALSPSEKQAHLLKVDSIVKSHVSKVKLILDLLLKEKYFGSTELQTACERYLNKV